jgi:hypothetical protein
MGFWHQVNKVTLSRDTYAAMHAAYAYYAP